MPSRGKRYRTFLAMVTAGVLLACAGCVHTRTVDLLPPAPPPQPTSERPMNVAPDTDATPPHPAAPSAPEISENLTPPPIADGIPVTAGPSAPPRPATEHAAEHGPEPVDRTPALQIVPTISPSEQQNYQRQTDSDAAFAQQVLAQAEKHQLDAQQRGWRDLVQSYLKQSQDAGKAGDWAAAQSFAQKARLTSTQLLNSL
jgi:hypothetical protein